MVDVEHEVDVDVDVQVDIEVDVGRRRIAKPTLLHMLFPMSSLV